MHHVAQILAGRQEAMRLDQAMQLLHRRFVLGAGLAVAEGGEQRRQLAAALGLYLLVADDVEARLRVEVGRIDDERVPLPVTTAIAHP